MPSHHERIDFAPPPPSGQWRAIALALLAHGLLIVALSISLHWQRDSEDAAVEAELWSSTVMQAAPKPVDTPPPPPPAPTPAPPAPTPAPPPAPQTKDADIALEKTRKQLELKRQQEELAKQQALKDKLAKDKAEKDKRDKAEKDKAEKLAAQKREDDKRKDQAKRDDQQAKAQEEKRRQDNIRRMQAMAAGTGAEDATGNAQQSSGPSGSYQGKLTAILRPKVTFAGTINGNPKAEIEVRTGPSGIVLSSRIVRSSGIAAWDSAALAAVQKTDRLPSDNGRFYNPLIISFGPQD